MKAPHLVRLDRKDEEGLDYADSIESAPPLEAAVDDDRIALSHGGFDITRGGR